jgi:simple sugar transport system substrate-binding protein
MLRGRRRSILVTLAVATAAVAAVAVLGSPGSAAEGRAAAEPSTPRIVTVVKLLGIGWFERMREGVRRFAADTGVNATLTGANDASPQKQILIIDRLIAEQSPPDAITVVPNSPKSLEPVLARARRAGIKVVTHEASNQRNTDVDIEAFDNTVFGAHVMDRLARCMHRRGTYVAFVGHLSAETHMEWVRTALRQARRRYPKIRRLGSPVVSLENVGTAYRKAKRLLARHPNLRGFEGSSAVDVVGIGRAVREAGKQRTTCVMGTSSPSLAGRYLKDGAVDRIFLWDPALAGEAQDRLALRLIRGQRVGPGLDLGIRGYRNLTRITGSPHGLSGSGWIDVDKRNAKNYPF